MNRDVRREDIEGPGVIRIEIHFVSVIPRADGKPYPLRSEKEARAKRDRGYTGDDGGSHTLINSTCIAWGPSSAGRKRVLDLLPQSSDTPEIRQHLLEPVEAFFSSTSPKTAIQLDLASA